MYKQTSEFINDIKNNIGIDENEKQFITDDTRNQLLNELIVSSGINKAELVKIITPTDNNGYKYLSGKRKMQRDILIKICITCQKDYTETSKILKQFEFLELYPRIKREYIIINGISNHKYLSEINQDLANEGEKQL